MQNPDILNELKAHLSARPEIRVAILYGSFSTGKETLQSDIDIGVAGTKKLSSETMVDLQTSLSLKTGREIDLIDLNAATGTVLKQALTCGSVIFNHDVALYSRILSRMVTNEADFERLRNSLLAEKRSKIFNG